MKKLVCILLSVAMLLCGCSGKSADEQKNTLLTDGGKTLKLLAITSSFGVDTTDYLYEIAKAQGVENVVVGRDDIAAISPTGTALQNARTSYFGDLLTRDTRHLNEIGKVIAGYTLFAALSGAPLTEVALTQVNPTFKLSDSNKEVILDSVNAALETPFAVTQSKYPD